jgi:uncharacterized protein (DUF2147 family)
LENLDLVHTAITLPAAPFKWAAIKMFRELYNKTTQSPSPAPPANNPANTKNTNTETTQSSEQVTKSPNEILYEKYKKQRPAYAKDQVKDTWNKAETESLDGNVYDPNTGRQLTWDGKTRQGKWDMGHKPEYKYEDQLDKLRRGEISEEQFLKNYKNSEHYRPEGVPENRSRKYDPQKPS